MSLDSTLTRRDLLVAAGIATAAAALPARAQTQPSTASAPSTLPPWVNRPMRWAQLVLVENDPGNFDPAFWLDYWQRIHADAVCLSAGGCVCYYPTQIEFHHRSTWMKEGTDPFGDLVTACRKFNMVILARTDPHSIRDDAAAAHPEWVAIDAQGNPRRHWATPNRWVTCALGPYNADFMTRIHQEIMQRYRVEGIFANRWQGSGMCYCDSCRQQFRAFCNLDLPRTTTITDPAYRNYLTWSSQRLFDIWRTWDAAIRAINPDSRFIANTGGGSTSTLDMVTIAQIAPTLAADRQSRRGLMAPWMAGKNAKEYRATMGSKPIIGIAALGIDDDHRWKDSVLNDAELRIWIADGTANGLRPWIAKFGGVVYDRRWMPTIEKIYNWHFQNEKYLRNTRNLARIGLVYSQQTAAFYGGIAKARRVEDHELGMYQALIEARLPFEMVHDHLLDAEHLAPFKLLILPNTACLSDTQCDQLRQFVARGGSILATFETSLYDAHGTRRSNFGLADLFGVSYAGSTLTDIKNSYMRIEADTRHPILKGLEDATRIINTVQCAQVKPTAQFPNPPLTRIPSYPDLPMEEVYPRIPRTVTPEVFLRELIPITQTGSTRRIVYFPGDLDRTFWETLTTDHAQLLRNALTWTLNEPPPATAVGPGMLDLTIWEQANSMTIHLVNLTNPMLLKPSYRELLPLPPQTITVQLPPGKNPRAIHLLAADKTPSSTRTGDTLTIQVDSILDFEVVAIDF